jgi:hypothetical protein
MLPELPDNQYIRTLHADNSIEDKQTVDSVGGILTSSSFMKTFDACMQWLYEQPCLCMDS